MIGRLHGQLLAKTPPVVLVDVGGVGYEVEVPLSILPDLPATGEPVTLITHLVIKDDAHSLYGFMESSQRTLFRSLLGVTGVGAKMALAILSGMTPAEFTGCVQTGDAASLTRLPGIGKKTAERLVLEMRDRIDTAIDPPPGGEGGGSRSEARDALVALGFKTAEAERLVSKAEARGEDGTEALIRAALRRAGSQ